MRQLIAKTAATLGDHLHIILYSYFWFGLFVCCLAAPDERVAMLGSRVVTHGWHLAIVCLAFGLPLPLVYRRQMRPSQRSATGSK